MKKQKAVSAVQDVEQHLNIGSQHDREQALSVWLDAIETGVFADAATPLRVFIELRNAFLKVSGKPAKVLPIFEQHTNGMNDTEKLFIARKVLFYFEQTVFDEGETDEPNTTLTGITEPLAAYIKRLKREGREARNDVKTGDLRQTLKDIFRQEMERLPEYLQSLEPKDRVNALCKMIPYALPKVEAVHFTEGEPFSFP